MRIGMLSWESLYSIKVGGIAPHVSELSEALARRGHEIHIFTRRGDFDTYDIINGVHYHRVDFDTFGDIIVQMDKMSNAMYESFAMTQKIFGKFDLVHGHDWHPVLALNRIKKDCSLPYVLTIHSTEWGRNGNNFGNRAISHREWLGGYESSQIIVTTKHMQEELQKVYSIPEHKIYIIPNGIVKGKMKRSLIPGRIKKRYSIDSANPLVLFFGRMSYQKGPDLLVEAIPLILKKHSDVKFVFRPEPAVRLSLLQTREADLAIDLLPDQAKQLDKAMVVSAEGLEGYTIRFGMKDPLSRDLRIRQAINLALDRKQLVELFAGFAYVPAGAQGWPSWAVGWAQRPTPYDLEKAKALVREAGAVGKEIEFAVTVGRHTLSGEVADVVGKMIEQTGLKVKLQKMPHQQWLTLVRDLNNPPALIFMSNGHETGEAAQNFRNKFMCSGVMSTYCSKEFDDLANAALSELDRQKRTAVVQKATDVLEKDLPIIPLVIPGYTYGKNARLQFTPLPNGFLPVVDMKLGS